MRYTATLYKLNTIMGSTDIYLKSLENEKILRTLSLSQNYMVYNDNFGYFCCWEMASYSFLYSIIEFKHLYVFSLK